MRASALAVPLAIAAWWFARGAAHATTVTAITVEALNARADAALVVTVPRAPRSQWIDGTLQSDIDLDVTATLHGDVPAGVRVTVRVPGGVVGAIAQRVPGVPALEIGHTYVVFLSHATGDPHGTHFWLTHLTASVLPVTTAPDGSVIVHPALEGMVVATDATAMPQRGVSLAALWRRLQAPR